jgi:hypothetical protein
MKILKNYSKIELKSDKNGITGRMGLGWIVQSMRHFGLERLIKEIYPKRYASNRQIEASRKILAGTMTMLAGGQRVEDIEVLGKDTGLLKAIGWERMISADTLLNFMGNENNNKFNIEINQRLGIKALKRITDRELTYDNDATQIDSDKKSAKYSYQKRKQFSVLMGTIVETGMIHTLDYRTGNVSVQTGILEQLQKACGQAQQAGKRIAVFRSDSAAYQDKIMSYCDKKGIRFYISVDKNESIQKQIAKIKETEWKIMGQPYEGNHDQEYAISEYRVFKGYKIRVLILRWPNPDPNLFDQNRYCYHVIGTNDWEIEAMSWLEKHNGRMGSIEQIHKEIKNELGCRYTPSHDFEKNRGYFILGVLAHSMMRIMNLFYLGSKAKQWTVKSLRYRFIYICGKLVKSGRKYTCKIFNVIDEIFDHYLHCHSCLKVT